MILILFRNGNSEIRSVTEMKKKYQNIKQKAKAKRSHAMRPPTGGGPRPESPTTPEQLVLQNLEGRPSLCGISGGIDSDIPMTSESCDTEAAAEEPESTQMFSSIDTSFLSS
ncbi:uncharacterized protein LOC124270083 [Haliotis rubra]|uniref:uncharacterized protein LOC124270083 n=1 Tax=Haliotis rubra TaxID=36100 RepID=UPI001EE61351|nr:uncharacterized protein LOC124270083 [Haliotis rubra]